MGGSPPLLLRAAVFWVLLVPLISAKEGVLHVFRTDNPLLKKDYCIVYNSKWTTLPSLLSNATPIPLLALISEELCTYSVHPPAMEDQAVLVMRGNCTFMEKAQIAQEAGAKALLIASKMELIPPAGNSTVKIPVVLVSYEDIEDLGHSLGFSVNVALYSPPTPLFDFSIVIIFLIAVLTVAVGGFWSGIEELERLKAAEESETELSRKLSDSLSFGPWNVIVFVVISCIMLVLLYLFYKWLVYLVIGIFFLSSAISLFICLAELMSKIPCGDCRFTFFKMDCEVREIFLLGFCIAAAVVWLVFRNEDSWAWILQDILGIAFCLVFIKTIKVPNFMCCVILLGLLLAYDVFFVFITPYITKNGESIMVEVARGPETSSEKNYENLLEASVEQSAPHEKLPVVMRVPRLQDPLATVCGIKFSLLGYGDIVLPGLLVAYCHRFDVQTNSTSVYYISCTLAYAVGLLITFLALFLMEMGQPALLYLVPCTLISCTVVACCRKEMKMFWKGNPYQAMAPAALAANEENSTLSSEQRGGE